MALADQGARVFIADRDLSESNRADFERLHIDSFVCDISRSGQIEAWMQSIRSKASRIDILVNNAGIVLVKQIPETTEAEWDACLDINFKSIFLLTRLVIPIMRASGGGSIVNISSNAGLLPRAHDPVYSTSKAAVIGLTKSLALCHADDRIRVNAVCPGPVSGTRIIDSALDRATDREGFEAALIDASPLARAFHRMITPEEVAQAVLYLASDAACMVTGTCIAIDGGKSLGVPPVRS